MHVIQLRDICYKYQGCKDDVLRGINFTLKDKSIVSIMGNSGSGKSTLLSILGAIVSPSSGTVNICGVDVTKLNDDKVTTFRSGNIGYVYQNHCLLKDFSVIENVALPLLLQNVKESKSYDDALSVLKSLNIEYTANRFPSELSGGERQRIAIARAIVNRPKVIVADEPTGSLDESQSVNVFSLLLKLVRLYNISCVVATHNLSLAHMTNVVYNLKDGVLSS
ncbi:ABC transporter ATP-binding protein [Candidatus Sneabacter namystus]|uniref:ABC transporter ATP-binding protein n=1 Tax=Candidatus Sneabacter namystus TaxID=2601646 RepID=A0A5C0UJY7_9RICK|nr:ABC transporter ATP-binding protein [Candidatus Sneabacter namystus]QEK39742.1 ABC transporter ATP-binding protein [Candidatus Sneabacter namystus]